MNLTRAAGHLPPRDEPQVARTAPAQGFSLIIIGPLLDRVLFGAWVTRYEYSVPAYAWLSASCAIAVLVNLSQFMCLGRFSAVSFQVRR